jgi:uncharacterized membrane protein
VTDSDSTSLAGPTSTGVEPRLSALLAYTAWWLSGLVFLIIEQQHRGVRFHAAQSVVVFGGLFLLILVLTAISVAMLVISAAAFQAAQMVVYLVWIAAIGIWLVLMVRTYKGETWRVPFASDLAQRIADH